MLGFILIAAILGIVYHKYQSLRSIVIAFALIIAVIFAVGFGIGIAARQIAIDHGTYQQSQSGDGHSSFETLEGLAVLAGVIYFFVRRKKKNQAPNLQPPAPPIQRNYPPKSF